MKILFLDFDGVINSSSWIRQVHEKRSNDDWSFMSRNHEEFDPSLVQMICDLVNETQATVVVSSSWRILHTLEEINEFLIDAGWSVDLPIDITPRTARGFRGDEVEMWLKEHPEVLAHVIIDDDGDFHPHQPLVQTHWDTGVEKCHIDRAKAILNGELNTPFIDEVMW